MPSSLSQTELSAWLRLSMEPGLSSADARRLLAVFGLPQEIYGASMGALARVVPAELVAQMRGEPPELAARSIERALVWADEPGHHVLTLADAAYPPRCSIRMIHRCCCTSMAMPPCCPVRRLP